MKLKRLPGLLALRGTGCSHGREPAIWSKADKRVIAAPIPWPRPLLGQWVEDASSGTMLLTSALAEGVVFRTLKCGTADKVQRAAPLSALYEAGRVYHLKGGSWLVGYEDEAATFPAGAHDDRVDVAAYAAQVALYDAIVRAGMAGLEEVAAQYAPDFDPEAPVEIRRPWTLESYELVGDMPEPAIVVSLGDDGDTIDSHDYGTASGLTGPAVQLLPEPPTDVPAGDWPEVLAPAPPPAPKPARLSVDPLSLD